MKHSHLSDRNCYVVGRAELLHSSVKVSTNNACRLTVEYRQAQRYVDSMAASLLAMLSQQTPNLPTRKGLILTGLQQDFLSPDGKLPVNNLESGFLDRTKALIDQFRGHGDIIWIRTETDGSKDPHELDDDACNVITSLTQHAQSESEGSSDDDASDPDTAQPSRKRKPGNGKSPSKEAQGSSRHKQPRASHSDNVTSANNPMEVDEEHFLTRTANRESCFIRGTTGADFAADVKTSVQPTDLQVTKSFYSAFSSTSLLLTLRTRLITELYICGAMTNLNVYATSMDAARYGIKITLVEDCLGYRQKERHDLAIKRLVDIMDADVAKCDEVISMIGGRGVAALQENETSRNHSAMGARVDAEVALEVASSDEDDDEDLLSVRASPCKSHKPLEIRGSRSQSGGLQEVDIGPEPDPEIQRLAPTEPVTGRHAGQRKPEDAVKHTRTSETIELEGSRPTSQQSIVQAKIDTTSEEHSDATAQPYLANLSRVDSQPPPSLSDTPRAQLQGEAQKRSATQRPRRQNRNTEKSNIIERHTKQSLFGLDKEEESGGSSITYDLLPPDRLDGLFYRLKEEVIWQRMHHQTGKVPRLVCCQGTIDSDGSMPVYRHPSDETIALLPWTSAVEEIHQGAERAVGHMLNHALIQLYRAGTDFISEHSDKSLDIVPGSFIVNASFGAERIMRLRTKRAAATHPSRTAASTSAPPTQESQARTTYRVRLPHNSALLMSLPTNAQYLHSINADKRAASELTPAEKAYDGQRISLTFRQIGTFLDAKSETIWGQGATGKYREDSHSVVSGDDAAVADLVKGFGAENAASEIRWEDWYRGGSDVLHMK